MPAMMMVMEFEVHCNTAEGMWTDVRNFLRPFKGVHKKYLAGYVAISEFRRNLKRVSPAFISALVTSHTLYLSVVFKLLGTARFAAAECAVATSNFGCRNAAGILSGYLFFFEGVGV